MGTCFSSCLGGGGGGGDGGGGGNSQPPPNALQHPVQYAAGLAGAAVQGALGYAQGGGQPQGNAPPHGGFGGGGGSGTSHAQGQPPAKPPRQVIAGAYVEKMPDGDTVTVRVPGGGDPVRVRVFAIDCPETKQNFGEDAGRIGRALIFHRTVTLHVQTTDRYGRLVAEIVMEDGRDFAREMLACGAAWHYTAYDRREELVDLEKRARANRVGLWAFERPQAPWDYRKRQRARN